MATLHTQSGNRLTLTDNLAAPTAAEGLIGMGMYNSSAPSYADGDVGFFQFTSDGRLKVDADISVTDIDVEIGAVEIKDATDDFRAVVKSDGTGYALVITSNLLSGQFTEDTGHTSADVGNFMMAVRNDSFQPFTSADYDYTPLITDSRGRLWIVEAPTAEATAVPSITRDTSVDEVAAVAIKASAGNMYGYSFDNPNGYDVFVKWYNTAAGSVVVGTTGVVRTTRVPAVGSVFVEAVKPQQNFTTAIAIACTKLIADGDSTAIATDIYAEVYYK